MDDNVLTALWSYGDKGNSCSKSKKHAPDCDENCDRITLPNSVIDLHNELVKWDQVGLRTTGVPTSIANVPFIVGQGQRFVPQGVHVELFLLEVKLEAVANYLIDRKIIDEEEFDEHFRRHYLEKLRAVREKAEKENVEVKPQIPIFGMTDLKEIKH